ncbi:hypothetical protein [Burkholderia ubonensis]|uniref:hypothetical protein n=1 Tax=Burkholderia ubonensis TaxID=101571 RepID=UPI0008FDE69B|nr:hypothetical protein [Burkholderia ubonensis]
METLADRLKLVIAAHVSQTRRFAELQELSANAISADSWKNVWHGRQRPTMEMVELAARTWPEHAFWMATGVPHPETGHEEPGAAGADWLVDLNVGEHVYAKRALKQRIQIKAAVESLLQQGDEAMTRQDAVRMLMHKQPELWHEAGMLEQMAMSERQLLSEKLLNDDKKKRR